MPARTTFLIVSAASDLRLMMRIVDDRILATDDKAGEGRTR